MTTTDRTAARRAWRRIIDTVVLIAGAGGALAMAWNASADWFLYFALASVTTAAAVLIVLRAYTSTRELPPVPFSARNVLTLAAAFWTNCLALVSSELYYVAVAALAVLVVLMAIAAPFPTAQRRQVGPPAIESIP